MLNRFLIIFTLTVLTLKASSQSGLCPSNLDFELGDFRGWECRTGTAGAPLPYPNIGAVAGRHTIISSANASIDPFGSFPTLCPFGGNYSIKLGNELNGTQAESVSYNYTIPSGLSTFSMLIFYAVVIEDPIPLSHIPANQPRFQARIIDVATNLPVACVDFDFIPQTVPGGFRVSPIPGNFNSRVLYKDWTPISINLNQYIGRDIRLEFVTRDCTQSGHAGYAYIDVGTTCNGAITGNYVCPGNNGINLNAPFGFQTYTWYSDNTFTSVLSNTQALNVTPAPPSGTIYPVVVEPFTGFGCRDTLYAEVLIAGNPPSNAGPDQTICIDDQVQIGTAPTPGLSYAWTPTAQVSSPTAANPLAWNTVPATTAEFILTTTDIITGCSAKDTMYITSQQADTSLSFTGKNVYCAGDPAAGILSVNTSVQSVQWYDGTTPIPGATGYTYQPTTSGSYWAQVQQLGCTDSTRITNFTINPVPVSVAGPDVNLCINETVQLGTAPNPAYTYSWTPVAQVSDATIANPQAWAINATPQQFIVHTTDPVTGCNSYDTTIITGLIMDTTLTLSGKTDFCNGDAAAGLLTVNNTLQGYQWYDGNTPLPGATAASFQPVVTGNYWAQLQNGACVDSTRTIAFNIHAIPIADFRMSNDTACITSNTFTFTNQSSTADGAAMTYRWQFSDGSTQTVTDAIKTFTVTGPITVRLTTTTQYGCTDVSADSTVHVMPNAKADFTWDSVCLFRPVQFTSRSNENGSPQVNYTWRFNNGLPDVLVQTPPPVVYTTAGQVDVTLRLVALGCENNADSVVKRIQANKPKDGIQYKDITVAEGVKEYIHARPGVGNIYNWQPPLQLSNYNTQYTQFTATDDVRYIITITDPHTCITKDTLQMLVLKKPGYYLPTAFTPNGDGLNDFAIPYLVGMKGLKSFTVFNRAGLQLFSTTTYQQGWDGRYRGEQQPNGVYVWILEYYDNNNRLVQQKGTITLIR